MKSHNTTTGEDTTHRTSKNDTIHKIKSNLTLTGILKTKTTGTLDHLIEIGAEIAYNTDDQKRKIVSELEKIGFRREEHNIYVDESDRIAVLTYAKC